MTEQELFAYFGKEIKVYCKDGKIIEGFCAVFTQALDNEPEVAQISLEVKHYKTGLIAITLPEIKKIEIMQ